MRATNPNTGGTATYDRGSGAPMLEITEAERGQQVLWGRNIGHFLPHKTGAERGQQVLWGRNIGHFLPHKTWRLQTSEAGLRKDDESAEKSDGGASRGQEFEEPWMRDDVAVTKVAVPFTKWVRMHVRRLLSTRTSFSYFLRRPSMAIFDKVFGVVDSLTADPEDPEIKVLSRAAAEELAVASCLAPILSSNVAVPFSTKIFATDASNSKGAYVSAEVEEELSKLLWRSADKKGQNLPLLTPSQSVRREYHWSFEEQGKGHDLPGEENEDEQKVPRPLGLWYEFVEVEQDLSLLSFIVEELCVVQFLTLQSPLLSMWPMRRSSGGSHIYVRRDYGLYPAGRFAPTRINPADAPTRNRSLEEPVPNSLCGVLGLSALHWLSQKPKLRRWASNWVRLVILTIPDHFRCRWQEGWRRHRAAWIVPEEVIGPHSQFDSTLGFPGEGPPRFALLGLPHLTLSFSVWIFVLCPLSCQGARGVPSGPFAVSHGDVARQRLRSGIELGHGVDCICKGCSRRKL